MHTCNVLCIVECTTSNLDILSEQDKTPSAEKYLKKFCRYAFIGHILEFLFLFLF
jgi:hypothetical protein